MCHCHHNIMLYVVGAMDINYILSLPNAPLERLSTYYSSFFMSQKNTISIANSPCQNNQRQCAADKRSINIVQIHRKDHSQPLHIYRMSIMKVIAAVIAASFFYSVTSANARDVPKLRINTIAIADAQEQESDKMHSNTNTATAAGALKVDLTPKKREKKSTTKMKAAAAAEVITSRERITTYVNKKQMFFIMDGVPMLYEDPSTAPLELTYVKWFCESANQPMLPPPMEMIIKHMIVS